MASIFMAMAIKDKYIHVKGCKDRFRDFVYIDDVVDAVIKALDREEGFDVFNVCTQELTTVETVIDTICKNVPYAVNVEYSGGTPGNQFGADSDALFTEREPKAAMMEYMAEGKGPFKYVHVGTVNFSYEEIMKKDFDLEKLRTKGTVLERQL